MSRPAFVRLVAAWATAVLALFNAILLARALADGAMDRGAGFRYLMSPRFMGHDRFTLNRSRPELLV
jgi:hypothetical protein